MSAQLYNLGRGYETVGRDTAESKLADLKPGGQLRFKAVSDANVGFVSHLFVATATLEEGFNTGRRRYMVGCTTCDRLLHEATTGPLENVDRHLRGRPLASMKALSLSQPWCWAVLWAGKHIENRSWQPPLSMIDQQIVIHAAKSWDERKIYLGPKPHTHMFDRMVTPTGYLLELGIDAPCRKDLYPAGAIVGLATIDRIVTKPDTLPEDQRRWFFGEFGWVLKNVIALPAPIPCGGKQGLWNVPGELLGQIREQAAA